MVGPSETGKSESIYNWLKIGTVQPKFDKNYIFYQISQPLYNVMQKQIQSLEFVRGVKLDFIDLIKKQRYKVLVNF